MKIGKKYLVFLVLFLWTSLFLFGQSDAEAREGRELLNLLSAVREAEPGDYILLPSGQRYILTAEEIEMARGNFDFSDLSELPSVTREDGTEVISLSPGHTVLRYNDGQSAHLMRTGRSFTMFMEQYVERNYFLAHFVDVNNNQHVSMYLPPPDFDVFRATAELQFISDGIDFINRVIITVHNFNGESFRRQYIAEEGFLWGHVRGNWNQVGEQRTIDFDTE